MVALRSSSPLHSEIGCIVPHPSTPKVLNPLPHVLAHEPLVEVTPQQVIHKLFALVLVLRAPRLVLKHDVVVPPPLDGEVGLCAAAVVVQQGVSPRNLPLALLRLRSGFLPLLPFALLLPLALDPLQLPLQLCLIVVAARVTIRRGVVVVVVFL